MFRFIVACLYFFLPGLIANMMASVSRRIPFLGFFEKPIDRGRKMKGNTILGSSKTWRGTIFGPFFGFLVLFLQVYLFRFDFFRDISFINYKEINIFIFGFLMTFGVVFGDIVFSFFKRRQNIKPGMPWIPFDQLDFVIGAFLFLTPYLNFVLGLDFGILNWVMIMIISFFLHVITNNIGYYLGIQKNRW